MQGLLISDRASFYERMCRHFASAEGGQAAAGELAGSDNRDSHRPLKAKVLKAFHRAD